MRSGTMILSSNVLNYNARGFGLYVELSEKLFGNMHKASCLFSSLKVLKMGL